MYKKALNIFEKTVIGVLIVLMCVVIAFSIIDIAVNLVRQFRHPPFLLLDVNRLLDTFGLFLLVLIGLELLETVKTYFLERTVHVQYILLVAMIAVARKITILDVKDVGPLPLTAMGFVILALSAGYYLFQKTHAGKPSQ
jgi:uncharacterized membrane protein (DUF373 family)